MTRKRIPSRATLERAFPGKGAELRQALELTAYVNAHPAAVELARRCHNPPRMAHKRLHVLNAILQGHGIEYVPQGHNARSPAFEYVNMGDTYSMTIVRFLDGRYLVTCWGSIVERGNYP